jgi:hypothetical protein
MRKGPRPRLDPAALAELLAAVAVERTYAAAPVRPAVTRLGRAVRAPGQDHGLGRVMELLVDTWLNRLPKDHALALERRITALAEAAEELGAEASVAQIVDGADQRARRPH